MKKTNVFLKKLLAAVMALALVLASAPSEAYASATPKDSKKVIKSLSASDVTSSVSDQTKQKILQENLDEDAAADQNIPSPTDEMQIIVTVKGDSVVNRMEELNYDSSEMAKFLKTKEGQALLKEINSTQNQVKDSIEKQGIEVNTVYSYYSIVNGFAMTVQYKDIAAIEKLPKVENVLISNLYEKDETENLNGGYGTGSAAPSGSEYANTSEYQGQGMVIGILDTGLDYTHEAFANAPAKQDLTEDDLQCMEYINNVQTSNAAALQYKNNNGDKLTADELYRSGKVPFAYDYADFDTDVNPSEAAVKDHGNDHGTHVAGIAAGKTVDTDGNVTFAGVAPEAQLAIFKVFSDSSDGAETTTILAALSDAAMLGIDVINMSLGSPAGFSSEETEEFMDSVYEMLDDLGTNVCCSAGNNYSSSYSSINGDYTLTSNPDNGVVGSSSSYTRNLSVASINANATSFFNVGGTSVAYNDISDHNFASEMGDGNYDYVMVPGAGNISDYDGINVSGKIAVVMRGTLTFTQKALNAAEKGAKACIIYNNRDGELLNMSITEYKIPTIAIAMPDGVMMGKQTTKAITIDSAIGGIATMSGFSSWGPLPSLELKPEITAPGGSIYSSLPGEDADGNCNYGMMSGTSMSAPYMTGVAAIVKQYLEKVYPDYNNEQLELLTNRLCMSTASIACDATGVAYSPRKQGAGVVDIDAALAAEAYIYVAGQDKTKLELGDDKDETGIYEMTFHVRNMESKTLTYNINTIVQTESVTSNGLCIAQKGYEFKDADTSNIQVSGGGTLTGETLTINPKGDAKVTVKVVLTDADKAYMKDNFKNGIYVEGFVCLESTDEEVDLSVPYLAFFGDWTKAPILDQEAFSGTKATMAASDVYAYYADDLYYAGDYVFGIPAGYKKPARAKDKIAVAFSMGDGIQSIYNVPLGQLRGAKTVDVSVTDAVTGQEYLSKTDVNVRKTYYSSSSGRMVQSLVGDMLPDLYEEQGVASNTQLIYTIDASLDYKGEQKNEKSSFTFPVYVDGEAPYLVNRDSLDIYEGTDGNKYLDVTFEDNHYLMAASLFSAINNSEVISPNKNYYKAMTPFADKTGVDVLPNTEKTLTFDVTSAYSDIQAKGCFYIIAYDYALNECCYRVDLSEQPVVEVPVEEITLSENAITLETNEGVQLNATVSPYNATCSTVIWESTDETIAQVNDGFVIGKSQGTAKIRATSLIDETIFAECDVTVTPEIAVVEPTSIDLGLYSALMPGDTSTITPSFYPVNTTDTDLTWSSKNENIATVDQNGVITAAKEGATIVTATSPTGVKGTLLVIVSDKDGFITLDTVKDYFKFGDIGDPKTYLIGYVGKAAVVSVPEGIVEMSFIMLNDTSTITDINIPASVKNIYTDSLHLFSSLKNINVDANNPIYTDNDGVLFDCSGKTLRYYAQGRTAKKYYVPEGTTCIASSAFLFNTSLLKVVLPSTLERIGDMAFYGCDSLTDYEFNSQYAPLLECSIYLPDEKTEMGMYANFMDSYFYLDENQNVIQKDLGLNMCYPEGGIGYNSRLWKAFFGTPSGSMTEVTADNKLSAAPVTCQIAPSTDHDVNVSWSKAALADYYIIERSVANAYEENGQETYTFDGFEQLAVVHDATEYTDSTARFGLTYAYRVTAVAVNADGTETKGTSSIGTIYVPAANAEEEAVVPVINAIEALKPLSALTSADAARVKAARAAYEALTDAQKALIPNLDVLVAAENKIAASQVKDLITAIGTPVKLSAKAAILAARAAYDALTADQQALVDNYSELVAAETTLAALEVPVKAVEEKIAAIGKVGLKSEDAIKAARAAYDALTEEEKAAVENYSALTSAETELARLKGEVKAAEEKITAIGKVSLKSEDAIKAARAAYNALNDEQKAAVSNYSTLTSAETELARLKKTAGPGTGDESSSMEWTYLMLAALGMGLVVIRRRRSSKAL